MYAEHSMALKLKASSRLKHTDQVRDSKDKQMGLHWNKKLLHLEENGDQVTKIAHEMGEIYPIPVWQGVNIQDTLVELTQKKISNSINKWETRETSLWNTNG